MKGLAKRLWSLTLVTAMISVVSACGTPAAGNNAASEGGGKAPQSGAGAKQATLNIWGWDNSDTAKKFYTEYEKSHPNVKITTTVVQREDMVTKLQTVLASGADMPDVVWMDPSYKGSLLSLNIWEDMSKAPYNVDTSGILDNLVPTEKNSKGAYIGPEVPSVGEMAFKRPLAKEYFGTDDPAALEPQFHDWNSVLAKGAEVKSKSGGKVFMFASLWDVYSMLYNQSTAPFAQGNQLKLKQNLAPMLQTLVNMKKAGIVDTLESNTPALNASYTDVIHIFYPCFNWSVQYTIKANDKGGSGKWGMMLPPGGPLSAGGSIWAVPQGSKNKEAAAEFIKYRYLSKDGATLLRDFQEYFSPLKALYQDGTFYSKKDDFFGGQDLQSRFANDIKQSYSPRMPTQYDRQINDAINSAIKTINASKDGNVSVDDLIKKMEDDLVQSFPDLKKS